MPEGEIRLFIAVPVPAPAVAACRSLIDGVRAHEASAAVRWVRLDGLHLTIRFLGPTTPDLLPAVTEAIRDAVARPPFPVTLAGAGAFPSARRPRALWLGVADGAADLAGIGTRLDAPLAGLGWQPEGRPFRPHLTIARTDAVPIALGASIADALTRAAAGWQTTFEADRVVLYRSHLGRGAPRYEPMAEIAVHG